MANTKKAIHPSWALKQKIPGTELRLIRGNYYLYEVTSKYNKELKRSKKITGKILGKVTEQGFIESKARIIEKNRIININYNQISIKDYGHIALIKSLTKEIIDELKVVFPLHWQSIFVLSCCRIINQYPLKKVELGYSSSFLSQLFPNVACSAKSLGSLLREVGVHRTKIVNFFKKFIDKENAHLLVDITSFISRSQTLCINQKGYNNKGFFDPQINLLMIFSSEIKMPVYYPKLKKQLITR